MDDNKSALRLRFDRYRQSLDDEAYATLSLAVYERLITLPEIRAAQVVHVYWPMLDRREIDTRRLIHWLKEQRKEIVLPVVLNFQRNSDEGTRLEHVRFPGEEELVVNRWGISEPEVRHAVPVDRLDAVVVPALGAGRNGHRIGHGYGFYDEFLGVLEVPTIALVYDGCFVESVPFDDHDTPMTIIVTESEVVRPGAHRSMDVTQRG